MAIKIDKGTMNTRSGEEESSERSSRSKRASRSSESRPAGRSARSSKASSSTKTQRRKSSASRSSARPSGTRDRRNRESDENENPRDRKKKVDNTPKIVAGAVLGTMALLLIVLVCVAAGGKKKKAAPRGFRAANPIQVHQPRPAALPGHAIYDMDLSVEQGKAERQFGKSDLRKQRASAKTNYKKSR